MARWIIVHGSPVDGLSFIGPFNSPEAAHEAVESDADIIDGDWWIAELAAPDAPD